MELLRNFVGSTVLLLVFLGYFKDRGPGISNSRDACWERAHRHFVLFCQTICQKPGLRSFTPAFFSVKTQNDFGWVNAKGSDVTLLVKWLVPLSRGFINDPLKAEHLTTLEHINIGATNIICWQRILYSHGNWLHRRCSMVLYQEIHEFLQHYNSLAYLCVTQWRFTGYSMTSKYHMCSHTKHEQGVLLDQVPLVKWTPSPLIWSGEMNEDVVGKVSRLSRRVDSRLTSKRTLQLCLIKAKAVHRRFLKSSRKKK